MIESDTRPWIKLWARWYESTSHALLSPQALHTGPHLLVLAAKYGRRDDGSAELVGPAGDPLSLGDLSRLTRWSPKAMGKIVRELEAAGTLERRGAVYVFPRFGSYQESKSLARVRKHRKRNCNADESVTASVTVTPSVTPMKRQRTEDRGQRTELTPPIAPQGAPSADDDPACRDKPEPKPPKPDAVVLEVLALMRRAVQSVTHGRDRGPQDCPGNRDLIKRCTKREGATLEHWRRVIAAQTESVRHNPDAWKYLTLSTLTVRKNWLRLLDAPVGSSTPRGPVDPSTQDHTAEPLF